jgi:hypothetical protein
MSAHLIAQFRASISASADLDDDADHILTPASIDECYVAQLRARLQSDGIDLSQKDCLGHEISDSFLQQCLRVRQLDVTRSASVASHFIRFRISEGWPFEIPFEHVHGVLNTQAHWILPHLDRHGRKTVVLNARFIDTSKFCVREYHKMGAYIMQEVTKSPQSQERGVNVVIDCSGASLGMLASMFHIEDIRRGTAMWREAFPCKIKRVYIINLHGLLYLTARCVLALLSHKLRKRVVFVSSNKREILADFETTAHLPHSLGGTDDKFDWLDAVKRHAF